MAEETKNEEPLFKDLSAENIDELETTEIESLCMNCHEQGITRLLLTRIPFFKAVVISSFECSHCHYSNNEIQPASSLQPQGCTYDVEIMTEEDMNRQVVKTDSASIKIPELDFEIPAFSQKGTLTTVEGVIHRAVQGLEQDQPVRRIMEPETATQIDAFIEKLKGISRPFHIILDDPSGNSFVENPIAPKPDPALKITHYQRTDEHQKMLGYVGESGRGEGEEHQPPAAAGSNEEDDPVAPDEIFEFPVNCPNCETPTTCRMQPIDIPFFKEVIIMATSCGSCGHRSNEVKSGGGIEDKGRRIMLKMTDTSDLNRDVLRASTCKLLIPDLDFIHSPMTTTGGKFTTIEGLLTDLRTSLSSQNPFVFGDSTGADQGQGMKMFIEKLNEIISGEKFVTIILEDPAGNSYLQNVYAPEEDPEMTIEEYERSWEENDFLGLTHMKTENYEEEELEGAQSDGKGDAS